MHRVLSPARRFAFTCCLAGLGLLSISAQASAPSSDGLTLLRMCKGASKVNALSVMCHSYLNGFLEAAGQYGKKRFCLGEHDKAHLPEDLAKWLEEHPDGHKQAAGQVLDRYLVEAFPCQRK